MPSWKGDADDNGNENGYEDDDKYEDFAGENYDDHHVTMGTVWVITFMMLMIMRRRITSMIRMITYMVTMLMQVKP